MLVDWIKPKKFFFKTKDIVAINAYLRQIYLSIHRIGRASYPEFVEYYQKRVMPDQVMEYVNRSRNVPIPQSIQPLLEHTIQRQTISIRGKQVVNPFIIFKNGIFRKVQRGTYLSVEEVQCIVFFLDAFAKLLQKPNAPVPPCDYLHSQMAHFCHYCLEPKLGAEGSDSVEHFMQTPSLNCLSIEAIVGDKNWYK